MSATIKGRIQAAEAALAELEANSPVIDVREVWRSLPRLIDHYRAMVGNLGIIARTNPTRVRECIRSILGQIRVKREKGVLAAEIGLNETRLAALAGGVPIEMVAGACLRQAL